MSSRLALASFRTLLPLAALAAGSVATAGDLPTSGELLDRAFEAMGGKAIDKLTSYVASSEMSSPMGTMASEVTWSKPDWVLVTRSMPEMGEMRMGTNGTIAWMNHPMMGYQLMEGDQLQEVRQQAVHERVMHLRESFEDTGTEARSVARVDFNGEPCYELKLERKTDGGTEHSTVYFDVKTGLVRGMKMTDRSRPGGNDTATVTLGEWKKIAGVNFFHRMELAGGAMNMAVRYTRIEPNAVKGGQLTVPEEVEALAAKQGDGTSGSAMRLEDFSPTTQQMIRDMLDSLPMDDAEALRGARNALSGQAARMPGEYKKGMEYVIAKIDERLKELQGE